MKGKTLTYHLERYKCTPYERRIKTIRKVKIKYNKNRIVQNRFPIIGGKKKEKN